MLISRQTFLRCLAGSVLGLAAGRSVRWTWAEEMGPAEMIDGMEVRKALPVIGDYEVNARFVSQGPGFGRRIALTFDDGPTPGVTEKILAELEKRAITASFFMIGQKVKVAPDLARQVQAGGHEICNHSYTHPALSKLTKEKVEWEIRSCQEIISSTLNWQPLWLRPPYGAFRHDQGPIALAQQLGVARWSVDPRDWSQPGAQKIADAILAETRPGSIVLLHDLHQQTAEAVPQIFDRLMERGFEFINLSAFVGKPYDPA